jgi:hypothetical protein
MHHQRFIRIKPPKELFNWVYESSLGPGWFFGDRRIGPIFRVPEYWGSFYSIEGQAQAKRSPSHTGEFVADEIEDHFLESDRSTLHLTSVGAEHPSRRRKMADHWVGKLAKRSAANRGGEWMRET